MKISDYLKPDWKKSNQEVRLKYITNLNANDNLVKIIVKILNQEKIPKLRKLAIEKITEVEQLFEILKAISEEQVKLEIKQYLIVVIKKNYIANKLKTEKYLNFLEQQDFLDLFFQVKSFNQKKTLIDKIKLPQDLLKILEKVPESEKDVIKFIIDHLKGQEVLILLLEERRWEKIAKKFSKEIQNALRINEILFSNYKNKILREKEKKILSLVEDEIKSLENLKDFSSTHMVSNLREKVEERYCFFREKMPLSSSLEEQLNHYQKLYLIKEKRAQDQIAFKKANDFFSQQKQVINHFQNNFTSSLEEANKKINQEIHNLEKFYNHLSENIQQAAKIKNDFLVNLDELKKLQKAFLREKIDKEKLQIAEKEKIKTIDDLIEKANDYLKKLDEEDVAALLKEVTIFQKEKKDIFNDPSYQMLSNFPLWEKSNKDLNERVAKKMEAIALIESQEKKMKKLKAIKDFFVNLNLADKKGEDLKEKLQEWDDLLNANYAKLDDGEIANHKKIILEVKKEIEEKEFREIQSYLDKKEALCKVLEGLLSSTDQRKILEILFEVNKKWHNVPLIDSFYFKDTHRRYFDLKKKCEEKTKEIYDDFQREQENKIARKKELLANLQVIAENKNITKKDILEVEKLLKEWKSIVIYAHFNERELHTVFKDKLNFFHKQKKKQPARNQ